MNLFKTQNNSRRRQTNFLNWKVELYFVQTDVKTIHPALNHTPVATSESKAWFLNIWSRDIKKCLEFFFSSNFSVNIYKSLKFAFQTLEVFPDVCESSACVTRFSSIVCQPQLNERVLFYSVISLRDAFTVTSFEGEFIASKRSCEFLQSFHLKYYTKPNQFERQIINEKEKNFPGNLTSLKVDFSIFPSAIRQTYLITDSTLFKYFPS